MIFTMVILIGAVLVTCLFGVAVIPRLDRPPSVVLAPRVLAHVTAGSVAARSAR